MLKNVFSRYRFSSNKINKYINNEYKQKSLIILSLNNFSKKVEQSKSLYFTINKKLFKI